VKHVLSKHARKRLHNGLHLQVALAVNVVPDEGVGGMSDESGASTEPIGCKTYTQKTFGMPSLSPKCVIACAISSSSVSTEPNGLEWSRRGSEGLQRTVTPFRLFRPAFFLAH
jgi:hypothetical protein